MALWGDPVCSSSSVDLPRPPFPSREPSWEPFPADLCGRLWRPFEIYGLEVWGSNPSGRATETLRYRGYVAQDPSG